MMGAKHDCNEKWQNSHILKKFILLQNSLITCFWLISYRLFCQACTLFLKFKNMFFLKKTGPEGLLVLSSLLSQYSSDLVTKYSVGSISISLSHSSSWELCCPISTYFPQQQWRNYLSPSARVYILAMRIIFSFLIHYIILNQSLNSF